MDDLAGVLIYLVLAIIGVIAGVYRNKAKREQAASKFKGKTQPVTTVNTDYDPFAGLFEEDEEEYLTEEDEEEDIEEQEEEFMEEEKVEAEKTYVVDKKGLTEKTEYEKGYIEGEAAFKETEEAILSDNGSDDSEIIIKTEKEMPLKLEADEHTLEIKDFDLKKAVIYSEIINRKEY